MTTTMTMTTTTTTTMTMTMTITLTIYHQQYFSWVSFGKTSHHSFPAHNTAD
jgi:hypothetical protein